MGTVAIRGMLASVGLAAATRTFPSSYMPSAARRDHSHSPSATNGPASSILIGEVAGTEDFATRKRVPEQRNATDQVFQASQRTPRHSLDAECANFLRRATGGDFLGRGQGRGGHGADCVRVGRGDKLTAAPKLPALRDGTLRQIGPQARIE